MAPLWELMVMMRLKKLIWVYSLRACGVFKLKMPYYSGFHSMCLFIVQHNEANKHTKKPNKAVEKGIVCVRSRYFLTAISENLLYSRKLSSLNGQSPLQAIALCNCSWNATLTCCFNAWLCETSRAPNQSWKEANVRGRERDEMAKRGKVTEETHHLGVIKTLHRLSCTNRKTDGHKSQSSPIYFGAMT